MGGRFSSSLLAFNNFLTDAFPSVFLVLVFYIYRYNSFRGEMAPLSQGIGVAAEAAEECFGSLLVCWVSELLVIVIILNLNFTSVNPLQMVFPHCSEVFSWLR